MMKILSRCESLNPICCFLLLPVSLRDPFLLSDSIYLRNLMPPWKLRRVTLKCILEHEACSCHEAIGYLLKIPHHISENFLLLGFQRPLHSHDLVLAKLPFSKSFPGFPSTNSSSEAETQCSWSSQVLPPAGHLNNISTSTEFKILSGRYPVLTHSCVSHSVLQRVSTQSLSIM